MQIKYFQLQCSPFLDYYHLVKDHQFDKIYRPNDDSHFFLDILYAQLSSFTNQDIILQIGTGSGVLITHLAQWLNTKNIFPIFLATDINFQACQFAQKYCQYYDHCVTIINTNITDGIKINPTKIICNPPYVPTSSQQLKNSLKKIKEADQLVKKGQIAKVKLVNCIDCSYAGGFKGMQVTWKIILRSLQILKIQEQNDIQQVIKKIKEVYKIQVEYLACKKFYNQQLYIVSIKKLK